MTAILSQYRDWLQSLPPGTVDDARPDELDSVVSIHLNAFPDNFITPYGARMVRLFYEALSSYPGGHCIVYRNELGAVVGFIGGVVNPGRFYRWLAPRYALRAALICMCSERKALLVLGSRFVSHLFVSNRKTSRISAEAESTTFAVDATVRDPSVAPFLIAAFLLFATSQRATTVLAGIRADNSRLLRLARLFGYQDVRCERRPDGYDMQILLWSEH